MGLDRPHKQRAAPVERPTTIYLNDREWLTVQTTPVALHEWAVGYLFGEGVIRHHSDLTRLVVDEDHGLVWADLTEADQPAPHQAQAQVQDQPAHRQAQAQDPPEAPAPATEPQFQPVAQSLTVPAATLLRWMHEMLAQAPLYQETGGMHVAMAVRADTGEQIVREDIGRHNAVDKVIGQALLNGWPPAQTVVLTSGRISYEMCTRLARFGAGIGVSRTAATDQAYDLATRLGIELVGYVRTEASLTVYTEGKRVPRRIPA